MAWLLLVVAGFFEVGFALGLKLSQGFTRPWPVVGMVFSGALSFSLLAWAMRGLPVGTAYAVWTGIGAAGTVAFGIVFLGEPAGLLRVGAIALILAGVVVLRLTEVG
ncbi:MAG: multidrug efflux SMR transporter [Rubrobacteraceae bacterium]|nr:multidrug efflux SMR transporter [Rubrobacteraceae bacterium]